MSRRSGLAPLLLGAAVLVSTLAGCATPSAGDGSQNTTERPSTTVPAPGGGTVDEVVPDAEEAPVVQVPFDGSADLGNGVVVTITGSEEVEVEATTPGEIAGPALALTITIRNDGPSDIATDAPIISVTSASGAYGQPTTSPPASTLPGSLAPGADGSGTYVFLLAADDRAGATVSVQYGAGAPVAVFSG